MDKNAFELHENRRFWKTRKSCPFGMVNECHEAGKNLPCQSRMFEIIRQRKMYIEQNKHY